MSEVLGTLVKGRFITFEGVEGSGKSTNIAWAADYLRSAGIEVLQTHEPGRTKIGEELRTVLLRTRDERLMPMTELFLMFASRMQLLEEVIIPALIRGTWVLCDRYVDSSIAYQGGGRALGVERVKTLIRAMGDRYAEPDLTVLLDIPPIVIPDRLADRPLDRFESEETSFFERIRQTYLELAAEEPRIEVIDATLPLKSIQEQIAVLLDVLVNESSNE
ncbi:MAG: dTMP kinase [Gammaproteobacteria bacterium]|nr:dTMP kinase [Gammaproteobacteria bacterium]